VPAVRLVGLCAASPRPAALRPHKERGRGPWAAKSRRYSTTLGQLRGVRRTWRAETNRARLGLPPIDPTTTFVIKSRQFVGTGYTPGEEFIAQGIRDDNAVRQQQRREGRGR
jgi:hypothetical protein